MVDAYPLVPEPLLVLLLAIVGPLLVLQHTPFAVIVTPPAFVIVPPLTAEADVMLEIAVVTNEGTVASGRVENEISLPYAVPAELVAYALT